MLKFAPVFLILSIVFGVLCLTATSVLPKIFFFSAVMVLFLSLLGTKRHA